MNFKLQKRHYFIYGLGVSYFMIDQIYNQWLQYYYLPPSNDKSLTPLLTSKSLIIAFIIARIIDAITDPVVGYLSDNSKSKYGKRSIFMMLGGLPLGIFTIMYFFPPKSSEIATLIFLSVVGGLYFTAYTLVAAPYNALIPDLASNKNERLNLSTSQSTFRLIFTGIAMILPGILISKLGGTNTETGIRATVIIISILAVIGVYACVFLLNEKKFSKNNEVKHKKSTGFFDSLKKMNEKEIILYFLGYFFFFSGFNILRGVMNYYISLVMKREMSYLTVTTLILFGVAGLFFPVTNKLGKKYSYKKILILDMILLIIGTIGLIFINENSYSFAYLFFVICGMGLSGAAFIFPQAMLSELSVKVSKIKNTSLEGFMFGIQGMFLKLAFLVQQVIQAVVLTFGNTGQLKGATSFGVKASLVVALVLFLISLFFYNLNKED
ncbi:MFS transporter [Leptotrichia sp. oral taxon 218]|mgnify:CR=1 FL=1|jgi:MFS transporter|uniref:MFS transporter n=1 Tax=Leptotrichia sp. oral taxon 218 TaxID=712361 RepID=UPI001B8AB721|nr:MFS transporter [Leptotrichia sp. oral taxon 218]QUB95413.1 MFS transporter [Leptotrichia sp. oral taxon 218]